MRALTSLLTSLLLLLSHVIDKYEGASNVTGGPMGQSYDTEAAEITTTTTTTHNVTSPGVGTNDTLPVPVIARLSFEVARGPPRGVKGPAGLAGDGDSAFRAMFVTVGCVGGLMLLAAVVLVCYVSQRRRRRPRRPTGPRDDTHDLVRDADTTKRREDGDTCYTVCEKSSYDLVLCGRRYLTDIYARKHRLTPNADVTVSSSSSNDATEKKRLVSASDEFVVADGEVQLSDVIDRGLLPDGRPRGPPTRLPHRATSPADGWALAVRYRHPAVDGWALARRPNSHVDFTYDDDNVYVETSRVTACVCVGLTTDGRPLKLFAVTFASYSADEARRAVDFRVYISDNLANAHERLKQERELGGVCVGGRQPLVGSNDGDLHITLTSADDVTWPWKLGTAEKATKVLPLKPFYSECPASHCVQFHCETKTTDECPANVTAAFTIAPATTPTEALARFTCAMLRLESSTELTEGD